MSVAFQREWCKGFLSLNPDPYEKEKTETGLVEYAYLERVEEHEYVWEASELPAVLYLASQC